MRLLKSDTDFLADLARRLRELPAAMGFGGAATQLETLVGPPSGKDSRTTPRRIRVRLFKVGADEPAADTDAGLPASDPGTWLVNGLPAMAQALAMCAASYHEGAMIAGLDKAELERRIKGLRPTLSRRGGDAVWRVPYTVDDAPWQARVDVLNA